MSKSTALIFILFFSILLRLERPVREGGREGGEGGEGEERKGKEGGRGKEREKGGFFAGLRNTG